MGLFFLKLGKSIQTMILRSKGASRFNIQFPLQFTRKTMSLEVRQFEVEEREGEWLWKFKLGSNSVSQIDFYAEEESLRSLFHLAQDMSHQIQSIVDRKKKKATPRDRVIRKLCEKMIKSLNISLKVFAHDIQEPAENIEGFFTKTQMEDQTKERLLKKCQKWIMEAWMSLPPEHYFKGCKKYLESLFKDGQKISSDFNLLNEFYLIIEGDKFAPSENMEPERLDSMVLIDINLNIDGKYISESFLWNSEEVSNTKINNFIENFLADALYQNGIEVSQQSFEDFVDQCRVQLRSQSLYKTLLRKHSNLLLNFSTMEISQDVREYLIEVELELKDDNGECFFQDSFEWDILNQSNNVQKFCRTLIQDEGLPEQFYSELCFKLKSRINAELHWKFTTLVKTFRLIHKDRESPKLNTQTLTQLKKNIIYTMDVSIPFNPDTSKSNPIYLNNSDLFSTLSRNVDILPEEFQQILQFKEAPRTGEKDQAEKISRQEANKSLLERNLLLEDNGYLGSFANSYKMHNIWKEELEFTK